MLERLESHSWAADCHKDAKDVVKQHGAEQGLGWCLDDDIIMITIISSYDISWYAYGILTIIALLYCYYIDIMDIIFITIHYIAFNLLLYCYYMSMPLESWTQMVLERGRATLTKKFTISSL